MKRFSIAACAVFALFSCEHKYAVNEVIVIGKVENIKTEKISITNKQDTFVIEVDSDGSFSDTLQAANGYFKIEAGQEKHEIFYKVVSI